MSSSRFISALCWAMALVLVSAAVTPVTSNLQVRNAPGMSSSDTLGILHRALSSAAVSKRGNSFTNSTSLDTSWDGAVLFSYSATADQGDTSISAGISIVCTSCYLAGTATATFTIDGNFNVSQAFANVSSEVETKVENVTSTVIDSVETVVENVTHSLTSGDFSIDDFDLPPVQLDFDIAIPDIPQCELQFQFDGLELYMEVETVLSSGATYTINLYKSETPIGVATRSSNELLLGVVFSVDLILSVEAEIDISSGFHILMNDGLTVNIPMFGKDVSSINFNGGHFEFLPVTIGSSSIVLTAALRIGVTVGLEVNSPTARIAGDDFEVSAGVAVGVFADIAQFSTNVTAAPNDSICELRVTEEYTMLLGANVGATLAIDGHTWGPAAETQIPIFYTTLAEACAVSGTASAAATTATLDARADLTETVISTEVTYTATICLSTGLVNCPVSLQSTVKNSVTQTLTTSVPSGSDAVFPATTQAVVSTLPFGTNKQTIGASSGSPVSYVPPTSTQESSGPSGQATGIGGVIEGKIKGSSNKVIIGVSVGVGLPVLIVAIAGCIFCFKRKRYTAVQKAESSYFAQKGLQTPEMQSPGSYMSGKKSPNVAVFEIPRKPVPLSYRSVSGYD